METQTDYKFILQKDLARRIDKNSKYSVRAYAKSLQLDSGALSRILSGKQIPSQKVVQKLLDNGMFDPKEQEGIIFSVLETQRKRVLLRKNIFLKEESKLERPQIFKTLDLDIFRIIGDWFHSAILELTFVKGFVSNNKWISSQLGISETQASLAIERLKRLKLIKEDNGNLVKSDQFLDTKEKDLTNSALKKNQKDFLDKAIDSLENDPISQRSMTSMTMAIDESKIEEARKLISEFNHKMSQFMEEGDQTRVYNLSIALYPLQKKEHLTTNITIFKEKK